MSRNRVRFYIVLAIVFAVFVVIAMAAPFERNTAFWISFVFAVIAMAVQLYAYPKALDFEGHDVRSKFYGFPIIRITTLYLAVQVILSLAVMILCKYVEVKNWILVILYTVLFALAAVGFIAVDSMKEEVERQETVHKANVGAMQALRSKAALLASQCDDPETKKALGALAENFRFSDPVSSDALKDIEDDLASLLDQLRNAIVAKDIGSVRTLCAKTETVLADRNRLCKLNK